MRRSSLAFWIMVPLGVGAVGLAVYVVTWGILLKRAFQHELVTPLTTVPCDLSEPGEYDIPVSVTYPAGHGFKLLVDGPARTPDRYEPEPWLKGLQGAVAVKSGPFVPETPQPLMGYPSFASGPDSRAIVRVWGSDPGEYVLHLSITAGAPALAGVPHKLVIYNDVCGCDLIPVFFGNILAMALGMVGVVLAGTGIGCRMTKPF